MQIRHGPTGRDGQIASDPARWAWLNDTIRGYGQRHPDVSVIDLHGAVCSNGYVEQVDGV